MNRQASLIELVENEGRERFLLTLPFFALVIVSNLIVDVVWAKEK